MIDPHDPYAPVFARMSVALPTIALGARAMESTFGRPSCFGRVCSGPGSTGYNEILFGLIAVGALASLRTVFIGPARWAGATGLVASCGAFLAPSFSLEIPALRQLWP